MFFAANQEEQPNGAPHLLFSFRWFIDGKHRFGHYDVLEPVDVHGPGVLHLPEYVSCPYVFLQRILGPCAQFLDHCSYIVSLFFLAGLAQVFHQLHEEASSGVASTQEEIERGHRLGQEISEALREAVFSWKI